MLLPQGVFVPLLARALVAWQRLGDNGVYTCSAIAGMPHNDFRPELYYLALGQLADFGASNWTQDLRKYLFLACGGNVVPMILDSSIERSSGFLDVIDILEMARTLNRHSPTDKPIALWKDFRAIGKLEEKTSRAKQREEGKARFGGQVGCAWLKCPMYGTEGLERRRPLACVRCKSTFYCGEFCQERYESHLTTEGGKYH